LKQCIDVSLRDNMLVHEKYVGPVPLNIVAAAASLQVAGSEGRGQDLGEEAGAPLGRELKNQSWRAGMFNFKLGSPRLILTSDFPIVLHASRKLHPCQQAQS
jgi:hypothetical protein